MSKHITLPCQKKQLKDLKAGEGVFLSGVIYTARDCAHKKLVALLDEGKPLPFDLTDNFIYYAGPCPAKPNMACGSCGPTTSARMEGFAPRLLDLGLGGMIGKGEMNDATVQAVKNNESVYFAAVGGAGAIYGSRIEKSELIAFPELLSEAVYKLTVKDFPAVVAIDSKGTTIY